MYAIKSYFKGDSAQFLRRNLPHGSDHRELDLIYESSKVRRYFWILHVATLGHLKTGTKCTPLLLWCISTILVETRFPLLDTAYPTL